MKRDHEFYIKKCFDLAKKSLGKTSPNPYVGSLIVKNDKIIGEGHHKKSGDNHAEVNAFENCTQDLKGATLYCNLEPCCHTNKKTPPCAQRIISEGIKKVVISNLDPNPHVAGNGVKLLQEAGIEVIVGVLESDGALLNEVFFTHITLKRPFIHLKWAQTLDGKVATTSFNSKWITGPTSREHAHQERNLYDAIMVGANTVNQDNPKLTIRLDKEKCIKRIVLSPSCDLNPDSHLFNDKFKNETIIITSAQSVSDYGVKQIICPMQGSEFNLEKLLNLFYKEGINSIYIEGGSKVINSFLKAGIYDRLSVYIAPKLLGEGIQSVHSIKVDSIKESIQFDNGFWKHLDNDILFESKRNLCLQD